MACGPLIGDFPTYKPPFIGDYPLPCLITRGLMKEKDDLIPNNWGFEWGLDLI